MARDPGHPVEIRARILHVFDGVTRLLGEIERAGYGLRSLALDTDDPFSGVTLSIPVRPETDLGVFAARLARHPAVVAAQVAAPSA